MQRNALWLSWKQMRKSVVVGLVAVAVVALACGKTDVVGPTNTPTVVAQDPTIPAPGQAVGTPAPQTAAGASAFANVQIFGDLKRVNIVALQYGITEFACRYTFGKDEYQTCEEHDPSRAEQEEVALSLRNCHHSDWERSFFLHLLARGTDRPSLLVRFQRV